jgi:hypothetical protein
MLIAMNPSFQVQRDAVVDREPDNARRGVTGLEVAAGHKCPSMAQANVPALVAGSCPT